MLACFPNQEGYKSKFRPPTDVEISNCFPRLLELLDLAQPKGIVLIGKLTDKLRKLKEFKDSPYSDLPFRKITHPSWSIREGKGDLDFHGISQLSSIAQLIREIG